jgi:RNase P/RNase MRP subunit POP5
VTLPPCPLFDLVGLRSNVRRPIKVAGRCGVPATATRALLKVTALQATGMGNLRLYPGDVTTTAAGLLRFDRGQTASASFDLSLATNGNGTLAILPFVRGNGTVRVMVEVDGYVP